MENNSTTLVWKTKTRMGIHAEKWNSEKTTTKATTNLIAPWAVNGSIVLWLWKTVPSVQQPFGVFCYVYVCNSSIKTWIIIKIKTRRLLFSFYLKFLCICRNAHPWIRINCRLLNIVHFRWTAAYRPEQILTMPTNIKTQIKIKYPPVLNNVSAYTKPPISVLKMVSVLTNLIELRPPLFWLYSLFCLLLIVHRQCMTEIQVSKYEHGTINYEISVHLNIQFISLIIIIIIVFLYKFFSLFHSYLYNFAHTLFVSLFCALLCFIFMNCS